MLDIENEVVDMVLDKGVYKPGFMVNHNKKGKVYLQGTCFLTSAIDMWETNGYEVTGSLGLSDIVCWLGGADINPELYNEKNVASSFSSMQDESDLKCLDKTGNRFKVGICRGAQLLNCVPNGGSLWQNIKGHGSGHKVTDVLTNVKYLTNSIHHQQMRPSEDAEIVAWTETSHYKMSEKDVWNKGDNDDKDIEALFYPKTKSLLVQWHPELGTEQSETYFMNLMERYFLAA